MALAAAALAAQADMISRLRATVDRHPGLTGVLAPVLRAHEAHAALLADAVPEEARSSPAATPGAASSAGSTAFPAGPEERRTLVPRAPARALRQLTGAEEELATVTRRHAFKARSGAFARVLGSMAASSAQYAAVLAGPVRGTTP